MSAVVCWILVIAIVLVAAALIGGAFVFHAAIMRLKTEKADDDVEGFMGKWTERYLESYRYLKSLKMKTYKMKSRDGLTLVARFFANPEAEKVVLMAHGYHGSVFKDFSGPSRFYFEKEKCSLFIIEERAQGASEGKYITFGVHESEDVADWAHFLNRLPENKGKDLYLLGLSMGASSVLMSCEEKLPENVRGIIADCGFASPWDQACDTAKRAMHVPAFPLLYVMNLYCRIFGHFSMKGRTAEEAMRRNEKIPVLFIHGLADDFVMPSNTVRDYSACAAKKELCMVEGATHAISYFVDPEAYEKAVSSFFAETKRGEK